MIHSIRNIPERFSNSSGFGSFRGPQYRPQNTIVPIIGTPQKVRLIMGNPHLGARDLGWDAHTRVDWGRRDVPGPNVKPLAWILALKKYMV